MNEITCRMQDVVLERENGFRLHVPAFALPPADGGALNKVPFMGVSGAGKSTLLNIMAALEWPHQGSISWTFPDNNTVAWGCKGPSGAEVRQLRREYFGFAFQNSTLMMHLSVGENLCYPLLLSGIAPKDAHDIARHALEKVLVDDEKSQKDELFSRFPGQLSGGQRQRVAVVQAMIHDPYVLFADEPTGSLDRETRRQVMQVLYDWVDDPQYTGKRLLLWVTHHENDPRDAGVQQMLHIKSGASVWTPCGMIERRHDEKIEES